MRHFFVLCVALAAGVASSSLFAEPPVAGGRVRVLLTYGGHGFEEQAFFAMFDALPGVTYTKAPLPESANLLKPGLEKDYDVIVMYDMAPGFTPEQQKAFVELLKQGIGVVALHHNLGAHQDWPEYAKIIAGKFFTKPGELDGQPAGQSGWDHDQELKIAIANQEHPITKGLQDFQIHDEVYNNYYTDPNATVLLKTDHPKNDPEIAWVSQYGRSPVFYLMLGHDSQAWKNPAYPELLGRGICWAAEKSAALRQK